MSCRRVGGQDECPQRPTRKAPAEADGYLGDVQAGETEGVRLWNLLLGRQPVAVEIVKPVVVQGLATQALRDPAPGGSDPDPEVLLVQYQALVQILVYLFQEFWQTNAFFTTATFVGITTWIVNWERYLESSWYSCIGVSSLFLFFVTVWRLSVSRHVTYIATHMSHACEIEQTIGGLELYTRRAKQREMHRLSVTQIWRHVPLVVAFAVLAMTVARFA